MSCNTLPIVPGTPKAIKAVLSAACTDKTGLTPANLVAGFTAAAASAGGQGALVADFTATAPSSTSAATAAFVLLVFYKSAAGVMELLREIAVAAGSGSTTAAGATTGPIFLNKNLEPGDSIWFGTTIALPVHVTGNAGEY
jgi:hypothetical protein